MKNKPLDEIIKMQNEAIVIYFNHFKALFGHLKLKDAKKMKSLLEEVIEEKKEIIEMLISKNGDGKNDF